MLSGRPTCVCYDVFPAFWIRAHWFGSGVNLEWWGNDMSASFWIWTEMQCGVMGPGLQPQTPLRFTSLLQMHPHSPSSQMSCCYMLWTSRLSPASESTTYACAGMADTERYGLTCSQMRVCGIECLIQIKRRQTNTNISLTAPVIPFFWVKESTRKTLIQAHVIKRYNTKRVERTTDCKYNFYISVTYGHTVFYFNANKECVPHISSEMQRPVKIKAANKRLCFFLEAELFQTMMA